MFIFKICAYRLLLVLIKYSDAEVFEQDIQTDIILSLTAAILFIMVLREAPQMFRESWLTAEKVLSEAVT